MDTISWLRATAIAFAAAYLGALFTAPLPEGAYDDTRVVALLSGGDLVSIVAGGYLLVAAGIAALAFTSLLTSSMRRARLSGAGISLVRGLGTAYGVLVMVSAVLFLAVPMGHVVGELPEATPSPFRELTMAGFASLLIPALLCAGLLVVVVSVLLRRSGLAAPWCTVPGFVVAPLLLAGFGWAPQFLFPLWAVLVAFGLRPEPAAERLATAPRESIA